LLTALGAVVLAAMPGDVAADPDRREYPVERYLAGLADGAGRD